VGRAEAAPSVVSVVEVPGLAGFDQLAAAAAADLAGGDEWLELSASSDVRVGIAAGVPTQRGLLACGAHAGSRAPGSVPTGRILSGGSQMRVGNVARISAIPS
jgi:hypothetical protein